jgi:murein DD-endopeptidase MepM/ murein hydrolase activator NlpD
MKNSSRIIFVSSNQKKLREFKVSKVKIFTYISLFLIIFFVSGKIGLDLLIDFSLNSKIERLERTNSVLVSRLEDMGKTVEAINSELGEIAEQDDELRTVIGLQPLSKDVREVGIGGTEYTFNIKDEVSGFDDNLKLGRQLENLDKISRGVKLELKSYKEMLLTYKLKSDSLAHLPALRPVLKGRVSSRFGSRIHPLYKVRKHHEGLDISAPRGTPVYASADGVVRFSGYYGGYGKMVKINHHYGFETRYAHMSKIVVRKGEKVRRGQKIGEVGSTGVSTAPHLHYEVRFKERALNPSHYYFDDETLNEAIVAKN